MPYPRVASQITPPRPWKAHPHVDGLIPIRTTREPIVDVCLVPIDDSEAVAEATAELIQYWSEQDAGQP